MPHVHISALTAISIFLQVIIVGFLWRLLSSHLAKSSNPTVAAMGKAGSVLY